MPENLHYTPARIRMLRCPRVLLSLRERVGVRGSRNPCHGCVTRAATDEVCRNFNTADTAVAHGDQSHLTHFRRGWNLAAATPACAAVRVPIS